MLIVLAYKTCCRGRQNEKRLLQCRVILNEVKNLNAPTLCIQILRNAQEALYIILCK